MNRRLFLLPAARDDIAAAAAWYEANRPGLGTAFLDRTNELLQRIAESPYQFPTVQLNVRRGLTRRFPYSVYFTVGENRVDVLAVIHLHRHPDAWKQGK